jgi:Na+-transporting NADH:ubiquinone oxidoreductase subunit B
MAEINKLVISKDLLVKRIAMIGSIPLFIGAWAKYGAKPILALILSLLVGLLMKIGQVWLLEKQEMSFPWHLFVLLPLAIPVGAPIWAPAIGATFSLIFVIWFFGGENKKIFNPLGLAMIFLIAGYSSVANFSLTKPFDGFRTGFYKYSSGISIGNDSQDFFRRIAQHINFETFIDGNLPGVPGNSFPIIVLILCAIIAFISFNARVWLCSAFGGFLFFHQLIFFNQSWLLQPMILLLGGTTAVCMLFVVVETESFSQRPVAIVLRGILFSFFLILLVSRANQIAGAFYAVILAETFSPLAEDVFFPQKSVEVKNES